MKYILVTGGVISSIGKGIIASSIGTILKSWGLRVTAIKIDPYINIDAGTFSPYEHGEVFVLNDGGEVDLDLGNYERFLDINLYKDNNITTGKIYQHVINKERRGDYLGKTVQVVPHITDAVQEWVMNQAMVPVDGHKEEPQICVIELGGTIGDIEGMPFVEAFRQFQFKAKRENFCNIHVSLVPQPSATGEQKTKPTQNSVRALRGLGLSPDLIVCRSSKPIEMAVKEKISMFCHVNPEQVICIHDVSSTYRVPVLLEEQGIVKYFKERLDLPIGDSANNLLFKWKNMADRYERLQKTCSIALVGKYTKLRDCYASVFKALEHSALAINHKLNLMRPREEGAAAEAEDSFGSSHDCSSGAPTSPAVGSGAAAAGARLAGFTGNIYYARSRTKIVGKVHEKFTLIDGIRVATGSYSFTWTDGKLNSSNLVILSGQVVEHLDLEFRILYAQSKPISSKLLSSFQISGKFDHLVDRKPLSKELTGVLVPGGFGIRGTLGKLQAISWARAKKIPFLDANSTEFEPSARVPVVIDMPEHNPGNLGGTMRLGIRRTVFKTENSILSKFLRLFVLRHRVSFALPFHLSAFLPAFLSPVSP
ncbi:CTP synthase 2 [Myotis davidii]|uniref:CTP synthase 2 n=1 Tax=Myotis davidii TaxID=225400 RepID=L5LHV3_MYODS|nr:CTP synthase 2 [Myotis davidii]